MVNRCCLVKNLTVPTLIAAVAISTLLIGLLAINQIGALAQMKEFSFIPIIAGGSLLVLDIPLIILGIKNAFTNLKQNRKLILEKSEQRENEEETPNTQTVNPDAIDFFSNLPIELSCHALSFVSDEDLKNFLRVSRTCFSICNQKMLFRRIMLRLAIHHAGIFSTNKIATIIPIRLLSKGEKIERRQRLEILIGICELEMKCKEFYFIEAIFDLNVENEYNSYSFIRYLSRSGHFDLSYYLCQIFPDAAKQIYFWNAYFGDLNSAEKLLEILQSEISTGEDSPEQGSQDSLEIARTLDKLSVVKAVAAYHGQIHFLKSANKIINNLIKNLRGAGDDFENEEQDFTDKIAELTADAVSQNTDKWTGIFDMLNNSKTNVETIHPCLLLLLAREIENKRKTNQSHENYNVFEKLGITKKIREELEECADCSEILCKLHPVPGLDEALTSWMPKQCKKTSDENELKQLVEEFIEPLKTHEEKANAWIQIAKAQAEVEGDTTGSCVAAKKEALQIDDSMIKAWLLIEIAGI